MVPYIKLQSQAEHTRDGRHDRRHRNLQNRELNNLYSSVNIIGMTKSRRIR
jgi:hypothetical protein